MTLNKQKLDTLLNQVLADLGGAFSIPLVRIGNALGIYKTLHKQGAMTSAQLAATTSLTERYLREWLAAQAASNYITYNPDNNTFSLTSEQAALLADDSSEMYITPAFDCAVAYLDNQSSVQKAFQTGAGVAWGNQSQCLSCAVAKFFRSGYQHNLVQQWLPALAGVVEKLERGAKVADVGCGHGISTLIMAQAFPHSEFTGFDFHDVSIAAAKQHAQAHGLTNLNFEKKLAKEYPGKYDLVTIFDCLHDMGDPEGAMTHVRSSLKEDGTCMIVEPMAGNNLEENLNPIGRLYYSASTMVCVPTSLAQEVGAALGAQAGENRLREVVVDGGKFSTFRRVAKTPFNLIFEARP